MAVRPGPAGLDLAQLRPYFSITIIECMAEDPERAFDSLTRFVRDQAARPSRAIEVEPLAEVVVGGAAAPANDVGGVFADLAAFGFEQAHGLVRRRTQVAPWAARDSTFVDTVNELTFALARNRLVAIRSDMISWRALSKWLGRSTTPYRMIPPAVLDGTFEGDGKMLWLQGVHRQRASKADFKSLGGTCLQEAVDALDDASFAMSAVSIDIVPAEESSVLRGRLTISPDKSSVSLKALSTFFEFLEATYEVLSMLEKSLASEEEPAATFPELAIRERDLSQVRGAFDIRIASPEEIQAMPQADEGTLERAELLRSAIFDVEGDAGSAAARVSVGSGGSTVGHLTLTPEPVKGGGVEVNVRFSGTPSDEQQTRTVRDALADGDLVSLYYETGHLIRNGRIVRENLSSPPFTAIEFASFDGFDVMREKPKVYGDQAIHDAIGSDDSLLTWVLTRYGNGLLTCDDGAGEIADFLHLDDNGTLTAIHVKAARSKAASRRIAVTAFEELVSQAVKNIKRLRHDDLRSALATPRITRPACWRDGTRVPDRQYFLDALSMRTAKDKTRVVLVQPHVLEGTYLAARAAVEAGSPGRDGSSLCLLDNLLHSTSRAVVSMWEDLTVVGSA